MINHISFGVNNPEKVANTLAELWGGVAMPFPPSPGGFVAFADDGRGTMVELVPIDVHLVPGTNFPDEATFTKETITEEYEGAFVAGNEPSLFGSVHLNINSPLDEDSIKAIAKREGWRLLYGKSRRRFVSIDRVLGREPLYARSKHTRNDRGLPENGDA